MADTEKKLETATDLKTQASQLKTAAKGKDITKNKDYLTARSKINRALYIEWISIPDMVRGLDDKALKKLGYPVDDPVFQKLLKIKTKSEFCKEIGVSSKMPSTWERSADFEKEVEAQMKKNVLRFKKDIDLAFTLKTIKYSDAQRVKLWKQLFEGWTEKSTNVNVNIETTPADLVLEIEKRNAFIRSGGTVEELEEQIEN